MDWYRNSEDANGELSQWGYIRTVGNAYANSGNLKYAEAMIRFVGANTVMIDHETQDRWDNSGRLETWASLPASGPGFTYLSSLNDAYRGLGGHHQCAILFLRSDPGYWLIPARPDSFTLEEGKGPLATPSPQKTLSKDYPCADGPYVALCQKAVNGPASFSVLLYPADEAGAPPGFEALAVRRDQQPFSTHDATGFRVRRGSGEVAISEMHFSAEPQARCRGSGVPLGYGGAFMGYEKTALAACTTRVPAEMTIEYRPKDGPEWRRFLNPEPTTDHYYLLTDLEHEKPYEVRITCRDAAGRLGSRSQVYHHLEPKPAPSPFARE
ncbi:MAG: fibronectin type III domain-containing protein [Verrucomicrobia bacterium]|nr:fibronectin type III domain-containing protein [Verrucomicrobiota bacterium]